MFRVFPGGNSYRHVTLYMYESDAQVFGDTCTQMLLSTCLEWDTPQRMAVDSPAGDLGRVVGEEVREGAHAKLSLGLQRQRQRLVIQVLPQ